MKVGKRKYEIDLIIDKLAKNVTLFNSKSEGFFTDNYFDMIPGKTYTIKLPRLCCC